MTAYQYEPLLSPDSIRLLVLQPSDCHDAKLKGSLLHITLAEVDEDWIDKHTALSYAWGSDVRPCLMLLDGGKFAITQSLHDALRNMRGLTRARRVWADALYINETDVAERNDQVKLMDKMMEWHLVPSSTSGVLPKMRLKLSLPREESTRMTFPSQIFGTLRRHVP